MPQSATGLLFANQGPGTVLSSDYVALPPGVDTVSLSITPAGSAPSATVTVLTSNDPTIGYTKPADPAAVQTVGSTSVPLVLVGGLLPYVKVQIAATSGSWTVQVTPSTISKAVQTSATQSTTATIGTVLLAANPATVLAYDSLAQTRVPVSVTGSSGDLAVGSYTELAVDCVFTLSGGVNPTIQFSVTRKDAFNDYSQVWQGVSHTAGGSESASIGMGGPTNAAFGDTIELAWAIGGSYGAGEGWDLKLTIKGK